MRNWWRRVIAWVLVVAAIVIDPGPVAAAPTCTTSGNGYEVTVCLVAPVDGSRLTATTRISIRVERTRGAPGLRFVNAYLDGEYLLQDAHHPYQFELPTQFFADGAHRLEIAATLRDGFQSERAALDLVFDNGNSVAPGPGRRFSPRGGDQLGDGPLLLAAVGDGASGSQASKDVVALIDGWNPDLFAYLGDVYQEGTPVEFYNWYGHGGTFFDRFHSITNPTVGNHEYDGGVAAGYRHY